MHELITVVLTILGCFISYKGYTMVFNNNNIKGNVTQSNISNIQGHGNNVIQGYDTQQMKFYNNITEMVIDLSDVTAEYSKAYIEKESDNRTILSINLRGNPYYGRKLIFKTFDEAVVYLNNLLKIVVS